MRKANRRYGHLNQFYGAYVSSGGGAVAYPLSSSIIFSSDLTSSKDAQIGASPTGSYTRAGTTFYSPDGTTLTTAAANTAIFGQPFSVGSYAPISGKGFVANVFGNNFLVRSQEFDTTWTAIATGSVSANEDNAPDGTATADEIIGGASGDGIRQSFVIGATARTLNYSCFLRCDSGSRTVTLKITTDLDATGASVNCTVTTSWKRFYVNLAKGAATTINVDILVNDTTGYRIFGWGAQCQDGNLSGKNAPCEYIKTEGATISAPVAPIVYDSANFSATFFQKGTLSYWVCFQANPGNTTEWPGAPVMYPVSFLNFTKIAPYQSSNSLGGGLIAWYRSISTLRYATITSLTWYNIMMAWDNTGATNIDMQLFINGVQVDSDTATAKPTDPAVDAMTVGSDGGVNATSSGSAYVSKIKCWENVKLSEANALQVFNIDKSYYGY